MTDDVKGLRDMLAQYGDKYVLAFDDLIAQGKNPLESYKAILVYRLQYIHTESKES